ncbi:MAG: hypothetical protein RIB61_13625 [Roseicyclus sp.]
MLRVTRDSGANVRLLRRLENDGLIQIHDVLLENGRENRKVKQKLIPIAVWGQSRWDESVWAPEENHFDEICAIIGRCNAADAMHLEAHLRCGNDVFVTEDSDFISKREELEMTFSCRIRTPEELETELRDQSPH